MAFQKAKKWFFFGFSLHCVGMKTLPQFPTRAGRLRQQTVAINGLNALILGGNFVLGAVAAVFCSK